MRNKIEKWKFIPDTQKRYEVSNMGRVRSVDRVVIYNDGRKYHYPSIYIKQCLDAYGYPSFCIRNHGTFKHYKTHRLVAMLFIKNRENKKEVNHKDGVKTNNNVCNLEWVTSSENKLHSIKLGLSNPVKNLKRKKGAENHNAKTLILYKNGEEIARYRPMYEAAKDGINIHRLYIKRRKNEQYKGMDYKII